MQKNVYNIAKLPKDSTFGYADSPILSEEYVTTAKTLERLQKGVVTGFGELFPEAITATAQRMDILEIYVEKDYWISMP